MEAKNYLELIQHWAWLLIIGLVIGAGGSYEFSKYQSPVYSASTRVQIISAPKGSGSDYGFINDQQLGQTYVQTIKTRPILDSVSKKLGYEINPVSISASALANTQLIDITVENADPQRAADIANSLVEIFVQSNAEKQALRFADSETSLKSQITQVENQISTLQSQTTAVSDAKLQENINKTKMEMDRLQSQIVGLKSEIFTLNSVKLVGKSTPTPSPEDILTINEKEFQLNQLQGTYDQYSQIYTNLVILGENSTKSDSSAQQMQSTLALYQQIRANLLSSYESIRLARLTSTSNIISIEPALAPSQPIRPKVLNNTGMGALMGLMLAATIIFLIEYLDDTLKTPEQIRQVLGLSVIGYIAEIEHGKKESAYVSENPRSPVSEAFRTLRTNLEFAGVDQPIKSLLIVSVHPSEGKSTVAANLSVTLAQSGKHVFLLDADLRRPHIHRFFGLNNRSGLSDLFRDTVSLADVTHPWSDPNLCIVTSGDIPPNPADLLGSKKMEKILNTAKRTADIVIVDAPPFLVADASILASRVDGVLLVIRPGKTPADAALSTLEQMKRSGARIIGVVMNRIPRNRPYYYGGYRHYTAYYKGAYTYYDSLDKKGSRHYSNRSARSALLGSLFSKPEKSKPEVESVDSPKIPIA